MCTILQMEPGHWITTMTVQWMMTMTCMMAIQVRKSDSEERPADFDCGQVVVINVRCIVMTYAYSSLFRPNRQQTKLACINSYSTTLYTTIAVTQLIINSDLKVIY